MFLLDSVALLSWSTLSASLSDESKIYIGRLELLIGRLVVGCFAAGNIECVVIFNVVGVVPFGLQYLIWIQLVCFGHSSLICGWLGRLPF